jgi:hypothetical protein
MNPMGSRNNGIEKGEPHSLAMSRNMEIPRYLLDEKVTV